jgi:hypothetical protein
MGTDPMDDLEELQEEEEILVSSSDEDSSEDGPADPKVSETACYFKCKKIKLF